jgi:hypothetical protein
MWTNNQLNSVLSSSFEINSDQLTAEQFFQKKSNNQEKSTLNQNLQIVNKKLTRKKRVIHMKRKRNEHNSVDLEKKQMCYPVKSPNIMVNYQKQKDEIDQTENKPKSFNKISTNDMSSDEARSPEELSELNIESNKTINLQSINQKKRKSKIEQYPNKFLYLHDLLGKGSFGEVFLVENLLNKELYAMKIINKSKIKKLQMLEYIMNEKEIMIKFKHPFIAKLHYALQNKKFLFLLMEYLPGGSLRELIHKST